MSLERLLASPASPFPLQAWLTPPSLRFSPPFRPPFRPCLQRRRFPPHPVPPFPGDVAPLDLTIRQLTPLPPLKLHRRHVGRYTGFPSVHRPSHLSLLSSLLRFFFSCLCPLHPSAHHGLQLPLLRGIRGGRKRGCTSQCAR